MVLRMPADPDKVKRAKAHPSRPGEDCKAAPGGYRPVIDRARCEGKRDCMAVCPYGVFEVRTIDETDFAALGFFGKLKSRAHGKQSAYTPHAEQCRACGLCVVSCPERAITLVRAGNDGEGRSQVHEGEGS